MYLKDQIDRGVKQDERSKTGFIALQVMADQDIVYSGTPWGDPDHAVFVFKGYGGDQGLSVWREEGSDEVPEEVRQAQAKKLVVYKKSTWQQFVNAKRDMFEFMENEELCNDWELDMIGVKRKFMKAGDTKPVLVDKLTEKPLNAFFVEHFCGCKIFLAISRARGGRASNAPNPFRRHCYPTVSPGLCCNGVYRVMEEAFRAFRRYGFGLPDLCKLFWLQAEFQEEEKEGSTRTIQKAFDGRQSGTGGTEEDQTELQDSQSSNESDDDSKDTSSALSFDSSVEGSEERRTLRSKKRRRMGYSSKGRHEKRSKRDHEIGCKTHEEESKRNQESTSQSSEDEC